MHFMYKICTSIEKLNVWMHNSYKYMVGGGGGVIMCLIDMKTVSKCKICFILSKQNIM